MNPISRNPNLKEFVLMMANRGKFDTDGERVDQVMSGRLVG